MRLFPLLTISLLMTLNLTTPHIPNTPTIDSSNDSTILILTLALTLSSSLQKSLYTSGLAHFSQKDFTATGFEDPFYANLQLVYGDEQSHASELSDMLAAMGIEPTSRLQYQFPYTDVSSFVALTSVVEGIGVSA